jgi:hypothetical protein
VIVKKPSSPLISDLTFVAHGGRGAARSSVLALTKVSEREIHKWFCPRTRARRQSLISGPITKTDLPLTVIAGEGCSFARGFPTN